MSERSFKNSGVRLGRLYGVDLWIHWTLVIWFGYVLYRVWVDRTEGQLEALAKTGLWWLVTFGTILFHEIGHCYFAYRQGGGADAIVLWPLGGLAYCDAPHLPRNQFWVAAGGPIFQLVPTALAGAVLLALRARGGVLLDFYPSDIDSYLLVALKAFFYWNVVMLVFNLLPLYPLDGGRMLQAILWGRLKSHGRGSLITMWVSRVTAITLLIIMLVVPERTTVPIAGFILVWALFETEKLRIRLQSGEEGEDYVFGYDFSRGYTSLERTATRNRPRAKRSMLERMRMRARENRQVREKEVHRQVDLLLEKIQREGMPSLSRKERKFLEWASRKFQRPS